ncbi:MAG: hypothetical protein EXQ95_02190 [Alphaproteobacteria bacterium]|nr:hypothetical protein [Alphaproteobacteria bacterium]
MNELIVERNPGETRIAIREGGRTIEVRLDRLGAASRIGTIHSARVLRVEAGIGAFLDIGGRMPAFLPDIGDKVVEGSAFAVQVAKDAVATKGPEVTRVLVLDSGPLALTPTQPGVAVSRKLPDAARRRFRARLKAILGGEVSPPGVLVRSRARETDDLEAICGELRQTWREVETRLDVAPPALLWSPPDPVLFLIRRSRPTRIVAGDAATLARLRTRSPVAVEKVERPFEALGIEDELARALAREIEVPQGRLLVEEGETLTAIDVNGTGDRLALCLAAARELGGLIRLRDLGGTLVVDFPFLDGKAERARVDAAMKAAVADDPLGIDCMGWTRAGLYEMTRPRLGPSLAARLLDVPEQRPTAETAALAALRALARAEGARLRLVASSDVIGWLAGAGQAALAEVARPVALEVRPGYGLERFEVVRD